MSSSSSTLFEESLQVEKLRSRPQLNFSLSSFMRAVTTSLSIGSLTEAMERSSVHSLMKMHGLRLSRLPGILRRCVRGLCAGGGQFSDAGGEPLRPVLVPGAGGQPGTTLVVAGG